MKYVTKLVILDILMAFACTALFLLTSSEGFTPLAISALAVYLIHFITTYSMYKKHMNRDNYTLKNDWNEEEWLDWNEEDEREWLDIYEPPKPVFKKAMDEVFGTGK